MEVHPRWIPKALQQSTLSCDVTPLKPTEIQIQTHAAFINPVDAQLMGFLVWPYLPSFFVPF